MYFQFQGKMLFIISKNSFQEYQLRGEYFANCFLYIIFDISCIFVSGIWEKFYCRDLTPSSISSFSNLTLIEVNLDFLKKNFPARLVWDYFTWTGLHSRAIFLGNLIIIFLWNNLIVRIGYRNLVLAVLCASPSLWNIKW